MNPIDQAFLNAYAKKKSVPRPQERSAPTEQVRPLGEQTADKRSFAHVPTQPAKPPQPHFEMGAMNTPSKRSPSIVVPTDAVPSVSLKAGRDSISPNEPTIRIRLDHASETKTRFPVPHVALQPLNVTSGPVEKVSEVQRRTLTSYLQKSRDSVAAPSETMPEAKPSAAHPAASTRWATPGNPPAQVHRIDPAHEKYPPVARPEPNLPWSEFGTERATKSTANSQSTAARTLNPPKSKVMPPSAANYLNTPDESPSPSSHEIPATDLPTPSKSRSPNTQRETEPSVAVKIPSPIQAIWEVDQFYWPASVASLLETQKDAFTDIGLHLQHIQSKGLRVLSVTSGERGVGRSTVALCLAKTVAMAGLRVAVIDGDYECPSMVDQLNLAVDYGWQQCLTENIPLDEVVIQSIEDNVAVVPLTDSIPASTVQNQEVRINKLIKRLSQAYDFVIIDGNRLTHKNPRLLGTGPESILDAAIVVVDAELSLRQRVDVAIDLLRHQGIDSIGIAENFHSEAKA